MDKHIEDLERYIKHDFMPGNLPFLEYCKDLYDGGCQDFKALVDRLETREADTMQLIIKEVNPKINRGRLIVCFVFAAYAKHRAEEGTIQNVDIAKILSPIDFEIKCHSKLDNQNSGKKWNRNGKQFTNIGAILYQRTYTKTVAKR